MTSPHVIAFDESRGAASTHVEDRDEVALAGQGQRAGQRSDRRQRSRCDHRGLAITAVKACDLVDHRSTSTSTTQDRNQRARCPRPDEPDGHESSHRVHRGRPPATPLWIMYVPYLRMNQRGHRPCHERQFRGLQQDYTLRLLQTPIAAHRHITPSTDPAPVIGSREPARDRAVGNTGSMTPATSSGNTRHGEAGTRRSTWIQSGPGGRIRATHVRRRCNLALTGE